MRTQDLAGLASRSDDKLTTGGEMCTRGYPNFLTTVHSGNAFGGGQEGSFRGFKGFPRLLFACSPHAPYPAIAGIGILPSTNKLNQPLQR